MSVSRFVSFVKVRKKSNRKNTKKNRKSGYLNFIITYKLLNNNKIKMLMNVNFTEKMI